jgi:hypothetical protein
LSFPFELEYERVEQQTVEVEPEKREQRQPVAEAQLET